MSGSEVTYAGRTGALATRHGKEHQFRPALASIGLEVVVADIDTDTFGTFTGEIPRRGHPAEVVERKARAALAASGLDVGLASEGSFGPHPQVPFLTADVELVVLVDARLGTVVMEQAMSFDTVADALTVANGDDPVEFCARVGFPAQALIVRPADGTRSHITKAISDRESLTRAIAIAAAASSDGKAIIETDLRAHYCPKRQVVVAQAVTRLAARLARLCPVCHTPGFGAVHLEPGLPCDLCGFPTEQPAATLETCPRCSHTVRTANPGTADPGTCAYCNP